MFAVVALQPLEAEVDDAFRVAAVRRGAIQADEVVPAGQVAPVHLAQVASEQAQREGVPAHRLPGFPQGGEGVPAPK
jgi:hypothetical protein